jgi:signal transduction histidine kinase
MQCVDEDLENEKKLFERFTETCTPFESEKRIKTKDGKIKWVRESVSPIYSPEGKLASSMGVVVDITEQKEIDRHKDEFISIASHELKTPLTSLKAYGEILEDKLTRNNYSDSVFLAQKINRQSDRC